jgi:hypothetical protein
VEVADTLRLNQRINRSAAHTQRTAPRFGPLGFELAVADNVCINLTV